MNALSSQEILAIAASIENYHSCFYTFFEMSSVQYSTTINTAAVRFGSGVELVLNKDFWDSLTPDEKLFVICHECLHVILDHGRRNAHEIKGATPALVNIAQDITINEMIVYFGFDRTKIRDWKKYCWIDTCFKDPTKILKNQTFYYYLNELIKDPSNADKVSLFDSHEESDQQPNYKTDAASTILENMSVDEINDLLKHCPGDPSLSGVTERIIEKKIAPLKLNFTHLLRKLKKTARHTKEHEIDSFTHEDRRMSNLFKRQKDVSVPGSRIDVRRGKHKLLTAVFMDVSISCVSYLPTFEKVLEAFNRETEIFELHPYIFDTKVTAVTGSKIYVGGGTLFDIIEAECQKLPRYPDCVVVITDGAGNEVKPKVPSRWVWLLTKQSTTQFIPTTSRHFLIENVTF